MDPLAIRVEFRRVLEIGPEGIRPEDGLWKFAINKRKRYCGNASVGRIGSKVEAESRLSWMKAELEKLQLPNEMPRGAFHGDTNPTNFLYSNGRVSAVLDFDQASYGFLLYDIASLVYWWTWPDKGEIDFGRSKELLDEYELSRRLTEDEKQYLYDMLKLVNHIGIGWFIYKDEDFANGKRKVELLNTIGREEFYRRLFGKVRILSLLCEMVPKKRLCEASFS